VIFGDEPSASRLLQELESRPELGFNVLRHILVAGSGSYELNWHLIHPSDTSKGIITDKELTAVIQQQRVSHIIVALDDRRGRLPVELLLSMKNRGVLVQDGIDLYEKVTGKIPIELLRLDRVIFSSGFRPSRFQVFTSASHPSCCRSLVWSLRYRYFLS
jgi:hypothetical protein